MSVTETELSELTPLCVECVTASSSHVDGRRPALTMVISSWLNRDSASVVSCEFGDMGEAGEEEEEEE